MFYLPNCRGQKTAKRSTVFESSCPLSTCVIIYGGGFTLSFFIIEREVGKLEKAIFLVFGLNRPGIEPRSTVSVADALWTRPLIGS